MDPKLLTGIIAAIAAIISAVITAATKGYFYRQKMKELQFQYETKLSDGYLEKAHAFTTDVYVPLSIALAKLGFAFQRINNIYYVKYL